MSKINIKKKIFFFLLIAYAFAYLPSSDLEEKVIETQHIADVIPLIYENTWFLVELDNCMFEGAQALGHTMILSKT